MGDEKDEEEFTGPMADRSCTDIICLILFGAFIVGMGVVSIMAYKDGNINILLRGYDSYGNVCGHHNDPIEGVEYSGMDMTGKGNLLYLNPDDIGSGKYLKAVCVNKCPNETYDDVDDIPLEFCLPGATQGDPNLCPETPLYESTAILHRCTPSDVIDGAKNAADKISGVGEEAFDTFASEVDRSWREIIYIILVGIGTALLMLVLIRFLAAIFVYVVYLLVILGSIGGTALLWVEYVNKKNDLDDTPEEYRTSDDEDDVTAFLAYAIVASIVTAILLVIMIFMWSRVKLVIALFKEAGEVIIAMPLIILQPFYTVIAVALFLGYWTITLLYIVACKDAVIKEFSYADLVKYETDEFMKYAVWYHVFGLFWVTQFLVACQLLIIAGAAAAWYFTRDKSKLGWFPILASFYRAVRYHLGTLAFGSLIIAIIQFITAILTYIQAKLGDSENLVARIILKCMFCFLWCLENIFKFINRNAYIMTAIYGYNFCTAAKRGFSLILSNAVRVTAINTVGDFCLFLAKLLIVIITVMAGIGICDTNEDIEIEAIPIALGAFVTYIIAHIFLSVYEMIVDTVFLCFCEDSERNDGSAAKPYFMSENLKDFMENNKLGNDDNEKEKGVR